MGCISSKKDKQAYCIEFELSLVAQIEKNKKKSGFHESQSSLNFSQKLSKSKCSQSCSTSHLSPTICEDCSGSCSENTNDSHSPSSSKVREKSLCKGGSFDNKILEKSGNQLDREQQPHTITCDHINALSDPNSLYIKCIHIYAKEYIVGIKIDHPIGGYCGESKCVLHTSSYEYYNEKYLIIEPNE